MKVKIATVIAALTLSACSSVKLSNNNDVPEMTPIQSQKLTSTFTRKGVKVEYDCIFSSVRNCTTGDIKAIEVTAYATSNGNTENNREKAFVVAELDAKAKLARFVKEDVQSQRVVNTITKNIEKANDNFSRGVKGEVKNTDEDADKEVNISERQNSNDIARMLTETVRSNSRAILKGVQVSEEKIVDRQTVQVTIRWDRDSEKLADFFGKKFAVPQQ